MMSVQHLTWMEIIHRKLNFFLAALAVAVASAYGVATVTSLKAYRLESEARVAALDNEIRKITKAMGFNINILPKDQNLADFHANDFAEKTMPYEYVMRLADSPDVVKIEHLRPALIQKLHWPEQNRQIVLMGVSGVIPWTHRPNNKKPLAEPVAPGKMVVGGVLAEELQLRPGSEVVLKGEPFVVDKVYAPRGSKDDITVWIDLPKAQEMLGLEGRVNLIQALECNCASIDRLAEIQQEISNVLGSEVQVIELSTTAIARARAREDVKAEGLARIASLQRRGLVQLVLLTFGGGLLVGLLALANVRERRNEIGILRAIGVSTRQIMALLLSKAVIIGVVGALVGYAAGFVIGTGTELDGGEGRAFSVSASVLFSVGPLVTVILLAPAIAALASWLPAVVAAGQDPAVVLRHE